MSLAEPDPLTILWKLFWKELNSHLTADSGTQASRNRGQGWEARADQEPLPSLGCRKDSLVLTRHLQKGLRQAAADTLLWPSGSPEGLAKSFIREVEGQWTGGSQDPWSFGPCSHDIAKTQERQEAEVVLGTAFGKHLSLQSTGSEVPSKLHPSLQYQEDLSLKPPQMPEACGCELEC